MIYFITDGTYTKIGQSNKPRNRLLSLQTANAQNLRIKYLFDIPDRYERLLHRKFKRYRTSSNNEWFCFDDGMLEIQLKRIDKVFHDIAYATHKANLINNTIYKEKSSFQNKIKRQNGVINRKNITRLLDDIKKDLSKSKKRISYKPYIKKYGFTSNEISYYVKSAKLSKKVYLHNSRIN